MPRLSAILDPWLFRSPFEGGRARRYAALHRPGFGDFDERLLAGLADALADATVALDLGSGPGVFAGKLARAHPHLRVVAVEPSASYACASSDAGRDHGAPAPRNVAHVRARGEAIPLADGAVQVALCITAIRHVADRGAAMRELRRVVSPGGAAYVVDLDPTASRARWRRHTASVPSWLARNVVCPLAGRTAPRAIDVARLACDAGWARADISPDPVQPFYILVLSN